VSIRRENREKGVRNHLPETGPLGASHKWFLIPLLLFLPAAAHAQVAVQFALETASPFIYEPFTLRLEVESDAPPETPQLPAVPDLAVTSVRRLPADPARRKHAFQVELIAERDGILTVPPFAVRADGETVMTSALRLRIRSPRPAAEMALAIAVEPALLRVGQPATVTVTWTSAVSFARCKQLALEIPLLMDERCRLFPLDPPVPDTERIGLPVNNVRLVAQTETLPDERRSLSFRFQLVPREPCVLRTPPARLVCALLDRERPPNESPSYFYNHFFEATGENEAYEQIYLTAPVPEIPVRALAETGRNAHFANIVGPCDLRVSVAPTDLVVGQPSLFTVHLDNLAFARHITELPSAAFDGLRPEFQLSAEPIRETATDHARSFTRILRPLRPGIARIPAIVIQTFNPDSGEYQTLRTASIPITVTPNPEDASRAVAPRLDSKPPIPLRGVRHNRVNDWSMVTVSSILEFLGRHWWAFVPLPPLLWLALLPLVRRWERCRRDPVYARAMAALRRFRGTTWRDEETAWRNYLADRLALCAEALTADTVAESLRARKVAESLVAETRRRFEEKDAADYGKRPAAQSQSTRNLVRRLHKATVPLLLACSLLVPVRGDAADSPDELFARALRIRGEKPDEAQPLFVDAALRFESAERFLNAGNGWFFAGENGRALANYLAAERRSPFDLQLRESIEFLRANRADAFPPPAAPSGRLAASWIRFCTWTPVLRVGLFVAAYLVAWMFFLTAQLAGWPIRRATWVMVVVAVIVPLVSVAQSSFWAAEGVVIEDTVARLGPGYAYDPALEQPLHKAAEFSWLETRQGWVRARLPDASEGWLRESDCMQVLTW
jgi:hypothetical protein